MNAGSQFAATKRLREHGKVVTVQGKGTCVALRPSHITPGVPWLPRA
jgi:hypothetical protein